MKVKHKSQLLIFFVVCKRLLPYIKDMIIDNQKSYAITNYRGTKRGRRAVDSDHVTLMLNLNLNVLPQKQQRAEMLDFKNINGRAIFKRKTTETNDFTDCFESMSPLLEQCENWFDTLKAYCKKSYPMIRIRSKHMKNSSADNLITRRNELKQHIEDGKSNKEEELHKLEVEIATIIEKEETNKAKLFTKFCNESSSINITEMWKLKKTIWPNKKESLPTGKLNNKGRIVTDSEELKELYLNEFKERLRSRPSHPEFKEIHDLKDSIFQLTIEKAKSILSNDWTMQDLEIVLKEIKKGKSRDSEGISRDIFHTSIIGNNLKLSLLIMFNKLKQEGKIPVFMKKAIISPIPKKGSQFQLKNERGIFIGNSVRGLLMKLVYNSQYYIIEENMSESNIGSRKNCSCIDHIFVLNSIIHDQLKSVRNPPLQLQICDFQQMFDGMNLQEARLDLYDSGVKDNHLTLIHESNKDIQIKVKTPNGLTVEHTLKENVLQGDTLSSIIASNHVDTIGKKLLEKNPDYLFKYKDEVPIGVLAMVDDTVTVTESGQKTQQMNAYFNVLAAKKRLQFSEFKCHTMLIHRSKDIHEISDLKVDLWRQTHDENNSFKETFDNKHTLKDTQYTKYLGCILSNDGSNAQNVKVKTNKAIGTRKVIKTLIKGLGKFTVESGIIYFKSLLRGSILYAAEAMINLKKKI